MTYEAAFKTVFWAKKGTKRRSKYYFNMLTEAFGQYPEKVTFSRQLPFKEGQE